MLFCKMNGLGNDFILFDRLNVPKREYEVILENKNTIVKNLCDRHFGIGSDGVVLLDESATADAKMMIVNADGTVANMCGNALRCVGKYLYDKYKKRDFIVETAVGDKQIEIIKSFDNCAVVKTEIGSPRLENTIQDLEFINVGNNHVVFYTDKLDDQAMNRARTLSKQYDANVEAVNFSNNELFIAIWERGVGETLACGTGSTAVAYSALNKGLFNDTIKINQKGGSLLANFENGNISLTGETFLNYIGEIEIKYYG